MFKEFFFVCSIIIVHELGHFLASRIFKWNLDKIAVYPFGGCVKFSEKINRPIKEELIILLSGPVFQIIFFFIVYFLSTKGVGLSYRNINIFEKYHYTLLIFNLLPIYPLDGGRILNLILNYLFPYKKSNIFVIIISVLIILIIIFLYKNLNFTLMGILLLTELFIYLKNQNYLYNRMLLERYMEPKKYKKLKVINNKDSMYKDKRHIIKYQDKYITEKDYLNKRFKVIK